ncbi:MAG: AEC family transporter [Clostridia bacterium]|nr:AEC family transporter [Clostridia bacterium]
MDLFIPTLNQMVFLFAFILIGYILAKIKVVPHGSAGVLAKLENWLFIPALVMQTFIQNFTVSNLGVTWKLFVFGFAIDAVVIPLSIFCSRLITKDSYIRKIYIYGLCFSNFAFMGNAVVNAIFPNVFYEYVVFTLTLWIPIYLWGVPALLVSDGQKKSMGARLRSFINPMFIAMIIGMIIGILNIPLPSSVSSVISVSASCMSPIAMLLTGFTVAEIDIKKTISKLSVYMISLIRLIVYPLIGIGLFAIIPFDIPDSYVICAICSIAMPLGLNTIVIPAAYGKDTSVASGMALVSHIFSVITIPLVFMLLRVIL